MSNSYELLDSAKFAPDMKLHRIDICQSKQEGKIVYTAFTLRTLASKLVTVLELDYLGRTSDSSDCSFFMVEEIRLSLIHRFGELYCR